ncbi:hypothetical protein FGG08_007192 [Glutinoglossum americanum]|uniref:Uncharacterized protein n=1 Tax=Glutinoglossum americanum TaxID=1670608 RepID=A0A9P8I1Z4_9PEZI|nr:hypothetical protein FGG08_007192 [Glutinoglossum americanum]
MMNCCYAPPGMSAPGVAPPPGIPGIPGMPQSQLQQPGRPGALPPSFQTPTNLPNINFSAPIIRLGTSSSTKPTTPVSGGGLGRKDSSGDAMSGGGGRGGVGSGHGGMEQQRQAVRESMMALVPPTKEEVLRTIFVGNIKNDIVSDEEVEKILWVAGNLRKWSRVTDADGKKCTFGFAEFEDAESLDTAVEVLKDIQVPVRRRTSGEQVKQGGGEGAETAKLLVLVDEGSLDYLQQFHRDRGPEDPITAQTRLDSARMELSNVLADIADPSKSQQVQVAKDGDGDTPMVDEDKVTAPQPEIVTIPLTIDDELADIPAEMRETVAAEIAAFRDRSNRRDLERLKREEEIESMERARNFGGQRVSRLASPPPQGAPSGPAGGTNGIPVGPRDRGVQGAPVGPKAFQGQQIPRDYQKGVAFVNGGINGGVGWSKQDDEDTDASDEELERRKKEKKNADLEKLYLDQERRWLNRERSRTLALDREKARDAEDELREKLERDAMTKRLRDWNDDVETTKKSEEYYLDRSMWIRNRALFKQRETEMDERDRAAEEREAQKEKEKRDQARGMADQFLARQAEEIERNAQATREPARFKLSLGAAAQKAQAAANPRRTVAEVEGLLEDEEESSATAKRTLVPIKFDSAAEAQGLSDEEREQAVRQLAAEIPSEKDGLWKWAVKWEFVDEAVVAEKLKPFVERKIVEYLGVQEQMLVEVVEDHIRKRGGPQELVMELEGALDEEAEVLVKKLWRMIIFFSESEKRGLSA